MLSGLTLAPWVGPQLKVNGPRYDIKIGIYIYIYIYTYILLFTNTLSILQGLLLPVDDSIWKRWMVSHLGPVPTWIRLNTCSTRNHQNLLYSAWILKLHETSKPLPKTPTHSHLPHPLHPTSIPTCKLFRSQIMMLQSWEPVKSTSPTVQRHCTKPLCPAKMWTQCLEEKLPSDQPRDLIDFGRPSFL